MVSPDPTAGDEPPPAVDEREADDGAARGVEPEAPAEETPRGEGRRPEHQARRIDAVMPRIVGLGRSVRLLVQVRMPASRPLGPEDWPAATRPDLVERDTRAVGLVFPRDAASGELLGLPLRVEASSDAFTIEPPAFDVEVPPDGESPLVKFRLTARSLGPAEVDIAVRAPAGPILGTAYIGTSVEGLEPVAPPLSSATARVFPQVVGAFAGLEIRLEQDAAGLHASCELDHVDGNSRSVLVEQAPVTLAYEPLLAAANDPVAYGGLLAGQLFADPRMREAWATARQHAAAAGAALRVSLRIEGPDELHRLYWETLRDPIDGQPIALGDQVLVSRFIPSPDVTSIPLPRRDELRALLAVASPTDLVAFGLDPIDVATEVREARRALGELATTLLADHPGAAGRASLEAIRAGLTAGAQVLYLICHGTQPAGEEPTLWLEDAGGASARVRASELVELIRLTGRRPLLVVLASCYSAGGGRADTLMALGPRLAYAGVPAVVGFQGQVEAVTARRLLAPLFADLGSADGVVDRALATARYGLRADGWWQAVLWLRTRSGRLWAPGGP